MVIRAKKCIFTANTRANKCRLESYLEGSKDLFEGLKADKRKVIGLGIELDENGKGLQDWKRTE